jgi:hypothetical protein
MPADRCDTGFRDPATGFLRRECRPGDAVSAVQPARLVVATDAALEVTDIVHEFNRRMEAQYRELVGEEAYLTLRAALRAIAPRDEMQPRLPPNP